MIQTPPVEAIAITTALALLALAIMFARVVRGTGPSQARRILVPTIWFVLGALLVFGLPMLFLMPASIALRAAALALPWLGGSALLSAGIAEGIVTMLGAERTPQWLSAGIVSAILVTYGWLLALTGDFFFRAEPVVIVPALVAAAAAIAWWPYLPRPEGAEAEDVEAAEVFE